MSAESSRSTIQLPELSSTRFGLSSADVRIVLGGADITSPQLILEGEDDAFRHSIEGGRLNVLENRPRNQMISNVSGGRGYSRVVIGGSYDNIVISGGSFSVNGVEVSAGDGTSISNMARRRASLLLPAGHLVSHEVSTQSGDVELEGLMARVLKVASQSGDIALRGTVAGEEITLKTMSGDIDIEATKSPRPITANTMSGDVEVSDGDAPWWSLTTMSGDVKVKRTKGKVNASSMSGSTRVV